MRAEREVGNREWDGWMASSSQRTWAWGNSWVWDNEGQESLAYCSPWGHKESGITGLLSNSNKDPLGLRGPMQFPQDYLPTPNEMPRGWAFYLSDPREETGNRTLHSSYLLFHLCFWWQLLSLVLQVVSRVTSGSMAKGMLCPSYWSDNQCMGWYWC